MMMMMMMSRKPRGSGYRSPMDVDVDTYLHDDLGDFFIYLIMWTCYVMLDS